VAEPIVTRLPDTQQAVVNKYQRLAPILQQLDPSARTAILRFDIQRAMRGQQPLSERQTALSLSSILSGQATTPRPERSFLERFGDDLRTLTSSIPRLPMAMVNEVRSLTDAGEEIRAGLDEGDIGRIAQAPGVRMIPGSFVVGKVAEGGLGALDDNPLFTALDVLPFVGRAARALPAVRAADAAADAAGLARPRPIPTALTRTLDEAGAVVPNRLGRGVQSATGAFNRTGPGQFIQEAFGPQARALSRTESQYSTRLRDELNPAGRPSDDPLVNLARETNTLRERYPDIDEARRTELTLSMQEDPLRLDNVTDTERAFLTDVREMTSRYADVGVQQGFLERIGGEVYDLAAAEKIRSARSSASRFGDFVNIRRAIEAADSDPATLLEIARGVGRRSDLGKSSKANLVEGLAHALDSAGFDNTQWLDWVKALRKGKIDARAIDRDIQWLSNTPPKPSVPVAEIQASIKSAARTDPTVARLLDHINGGRIGEARKIAKILAGRKRFVIEGIDGYLDTLERGARRERWLAKHSQFTDKRLAKLEATATRLVEQTPPARFGPILSRTTDERLLARLIDRNEADRTILTEAGEDVSGIPSVDAITQAVMERRYSDIPGFKEKELSRIRKEVNATWQALRDEGIDPVFVHRVTPGRSAALAYPRVLEAIRTPSQARARTGDITPYIQDATVALSHQGLEWLARRGSEEFIAEVVQKWGKTEDALLAEYLPAARRRAESDPMLDVRAHAVELMKKEYTRYDPKGLVTWPAPRLTGIGENVWLPKTMSNNIQRMHTPPTGRLTTLMDPVMKVFRTSLLPLSPRWHLYNIMGGGMMTVLRTDPTVFTKFGAARRMIRDGLIPDELRAVMANNEARMSAEMSYRAGITGGRLMNEIADARAQGFIKQVGEATRPVRDAAGKVIEKSYEWNSMADDMYRAMAYLYGYDKSITKGLTEEAAQRAGITLTRKIMQSWDEITPLERTIMRYMFPFYGFIQHIMRYTLAYPFDHPIRTAIMGSFARNELEDMGTGLPERFLNSFFLGEPDKNGMVKAINLQGMNPFSDVSSYFSLAGLAGMSNPIASTVMQSLGLDPMTGGPELFPNLRYDPETGRLAADNPGFLSNLVQNIVPQSRVLMGLTSTSSEFKELLRTNPEAASRMLRSQAGLPIIFRDVDIPGEITKAELARDDAIQEAFRNALRTGQHESATRAYPTLGALLGQVRTLQGNGTLDDFTPVPPASFPGAQPASLLEIAQKALVRDNVP
jgi:hypothetical protein